MLPFFANTNNFEYPLSGDVIQDISPSFFAAQIGVPEIEREVVTKIASYGDQIGALTDVVLALAGQAALKSDEVEELQRIAGEVDDAKKRMRRALRARAEAALRRLEAADPEAYAEVMGKAS